MSTEAVRQGAITEIYKKSNRELAAEVDALRALAQDLAEFVDTTILDSITDEHPILKKIMEAK